MMSVPVSRPSRLLTMPRVAVLRGHAGHFVKSQFTREGALFESSE
jgi:hypothetical protein